MPKTWKTLVSRFYGRDREAGQTEAGWLGGRNIDTMALRFQRTDTSSVVIFSR